MKVIAEELDTSAHKDIFKALFIKFSNILENGDKHALIIATIKAGNLISFDKKLILVGIFSKAIITFMGQHQLVRLFSRMIELSELKILKDF